MKFILPFLLLIRAQAYILTSEELPIEIQLLIRGIQSYEMTPKEKSSFEKKVLAFDNLLSKFPPEQKSILIKAEIYKNILEAAPSDSPNDITALDDENLQQLKLTLENGKEKYHVFSHWLVQGFINDIEKITGVILGPKSSIEARMKRKAQLLVAWSHKIKTLKAEDLNLYLKPLMAKTLNEIIYYSEILVKYSSVKRIKTKLNRDLSKLQHFSYSSTAPLDQSEIDKQLAKINNKVDEAPPAESLIWSLDDFENNSDDLVPEPQWTPSNTEMSAQFIGPKPLVPIYPTPNPLYTPSFPLPLPVNDWQ